MREPPGVVPKTVPPGVVLRSRASKNSPSRPGEASEKDPGIGAILVGVLFLFVSFLSLFFFFFFLFFPFIFLSSLRGTSSRGEETPDGKHAPRSRRRAGRRSDTRTGNGDAARAGNGNLLAHRQEAEQPCNPLECNSNAKQLESFEDF